MFEKINFPLYQNQWFGINFKTLKTKKLLFKKADKNFYTNFYIEFKKNFKNINSLPSNYKNEKNKLADFIYQNYFDKTILSYGSGLGIIELNLVESSVDITCYESAKNANFLVQDSLIYKEILPQIKYDVIYFSYVLYSMTKSEIYKLINSLKDNLNNKGEIIIFFTERSKINLKDILKIIKIILFGKGEFQFWGYERNSKFYVSIFENAGYELHEALDINNHRCLIFKFKKI
mgnify:FL=1